MSKRRMTERSLVNCGSSRRTHSGFAGRITPRRTLIMSDALRSSASSIKTLAVRMSEDQRAQLDILAGLNDRTVTDEIRTAIEAWIERSKSDPKILALADHAREQIEREASTRRTAIAAIFDKPGAPVAKSGATASPAATARPPGRQASSPRSGFPTSV
jgi:predicted DNA-binding protein